MIDVMEACIRSGIKEQQDKIEADLKEKQAAKELRERMLMLAVQAFGNSQSPGYITAAAEEFRKYVEGEK